MTTKSARDLVVSHYGHEKSPVYMARVGPEKTQELYKALFDDFGPSGFIAAFDDLLQRSGGRQSKTANLQY